jgi:hypothetical protein
MNLSDFDLLSHSDLGDEDHARLSLDHAKKDMPPFRNSLPSQATHPGLVWKN